MVCAVKYRENSARVPVECTARARSAPSAVRAEGSIVGRSRLSTIIERDLDSHATGASADRSAANNGGFHG